MKRLIVLGTGTGVGKTWVTAELARTLASVDPHLGILPLKPVESGSGPHSSILRPASPPDGEVRVGPSGSELRASEVRTAEPRLQAPSDAQLLARAARAASAPTSARYALEDPVSPHLAAARAGVVIDFDEIAAWVGHWERQAFQAPGDERPIVSQATPHTTSIVTHGLLGETSNGRSFPRTLTLIETAGGVFSPIAPGRFAPQGSPAHGPPLTNFELACMLVDARWVLVAPDALGVLHDVTATLLAMRARGRLPDWLVLSASRTPDASTGTNAGELESLGIAAPLDVFSRGSRGGGARLSRAVLAWLHGV